MTDREQRLKELLITAKLFIETVHEQLGPMPSSSKVLADIEKELEAK